MDSDDDTVIMPRRDFDALLKEIEELKDRLSVHPVNDTNGFDKDHTQK